MATRTARDYLTVTNRVIEPELARRVVWEAQAVDAKFPGLFRLQFNANRLAWHGSVPVEGRYASIVVTYPGAYPALPPDLETLVVLPPSTPHVLGRFGGRTRLCWISPHAPSPRRRWDPGHHTAATVIRAAQRWFLAFLVWQTCGQWPVPDAWE